MGLTLAIFNALRKYPCSKHLLKYSLKKLAIYSPAIFIKFNGNVFRTSCFFGILILNYLINFCWYNWLKKQEGIFDGISLINES